MLDINTSVPKAKAFLAKLTRASDTVRTITMEEASETTSVIWTQVTTPPALHSGNRPPTPYWIRGVGRISNASGTIDRPSYQFSGNTRHVNVIQQKDAIRSKSTVPYASYVAGRHQSRAMHRKGWRKLYDVATEVFDKKKKDNSFASKITTGLSKLFSNI